MDNTIETILEYGGQVAVDTAMSIIENQQAQIEELAGRVAEHDELEERRQQARQIAQSKGQLKELRKRSPYFTMAEQDALQELSLSDAERALLMVLAPRMQIRTNIVTGRKKIPLNQTDIAKLMNWSKGYLSKTLASLIVKGVVMEEQAGRSRIYRLNPLCFFKGRRTNDAPFVKLFNEPLKSLSLDTDARALLFVMAIHLQYKSGYVVDGDRHIGQAGLLRLMGWTNKSKLNRHIRELQDADLAFVEKEGRNLRYRLNPEYCAVE